jgi:polar amino acid transport system ATP-binding protein
MTAQIKIKNLHKSFDNLDVLKGINLEIDKGQVVCVIGASGSGKSTFLRCINRLEEPTGGEITVDDIVITNPGVDMIKVRRHIGMVFQQFNLFPHLTAKQNIMMAPLELKLNSKKRSWQKRLKLWVEWVGRQLDALPDNFPVVRGGCVRGDLPERWPGDCHHAY